MNLQQTANREITSRMRSFSARLSIREVRLRRVAAVECFSSESKIELPGIANVFSGVLAQKHMRASMAGNVDNLMIAIDVFNGGLIQVYIGASRE